ELGALEGERDAAAAALRESDRAVASAMAALRGTDAQIARQESGLQELQAQRSALATRLQHQRQALAALLRAAHAAGRGQRLKLLLAQDRLDAAARALAYHRIFQRDQVARIQRLLGELAELARLGERISARRQPLAEGRAAQQQGVAVLEGERSQRRQLREQLQRQHADRASRLAALGRDEKALAALLERLRDVFADIPQQLDGDRPLAELKGRLPAPLQG